MDKIILIHQCLVCNTFILMPVRYSKTFPSIRAVLSFFILFKFSRFVAFNICPRIVWHRLSQNSHEKYNWQFILTTISLFSSFTLYKTCHIGIYNHHPKGRELMKVHCMPLSFIPAILGLKIPNYNPMIL